MPSQVPLDRAVIADALDDTSILNPEKWSDEDLKYLVEEFTAPPLTNYTHKQPLQDKIYQHHPGADIYEDAEYEALKMQRKEEAKYIENPNYKILIATPPSCSESVSLHINKFGKTVCKNAIYFDGCVEK